MSTKPYLHNQSPVLGEPLHPADAELLSPEATDRVERVLEVRKQNAPTQLHSLSAMAAELGIGALHVKDEGGRLGLGSFKALGGAYALMILVLEEASRRLGRAVEEGELFSPEVSPDYS